MYEGGRDYTFCIGKYRFGFQEATHNTLALGPNSHVVREHITLLFAGPLGGFHRVPVSAVQGWLIVAALFVSLLATVARLSFRRRFRPDPPPAG